MRGMADLKALLPWEDPDGFLGGLPVGVDAAYYAGGELPASVDDVEFYVPSYMGSSEVVEVIARLPALKVVQTQTAGYENLLPHLRDDVTLCNARGVHDASTAELAVGLILATYRRLPRAVKNQERGEWPTSYVELDDSLADRTVLILGYGSIGEALERRLDGFECDIIRVARPAAGRRPLDRGAAGPAAARGRGRAADSGDRGDPRDGRREVPCAVEGRRAAGERGAGCRRRYRCAAGRADHGADQCRAGRDRSGAVACGHPLWSAPNVLINPHRGGASTAFSPRVARLVRAQLERFAKGEPLINVVAGPPR